MRQSNFFKFILHEDDVKINGKDPEEAIKDKQNTSYGSATYH